MHYTFDRQKVLISILLVAATAAVYGQVIGFGFVNLDDHPYVLDNPTVLQGLTIRGVLWAFTTFHADFWHPLTWLSHMLDVELFGLWAGGHHLTSLLLHLASTVILFLALAAMTGANAPSAAVAALFALHPLHVESVAWVAERKDVLSTLFFMLTVLAYAKYSRTGRWAHYGVVVLFFVLSLMAKPMLVTVPVILVLLDFWPLRRFSLQDLKSPRTLLPLLEEKVPFLMIGFLFGIVAVLAQIHSGVAMPFSGGYPMWIRIVNGMVSYGTYLVLTVWPTGLVPFYQHAGEQVSLWKAGVSVMAILAAAAFACWKARKYPYLIVGLAWYLIMLLPVIGILQVGWHSMADRYTYIPLIGIFIMIAWGMSDLVEGRPWGKAALAVTAGGVMGALMILAWVQVGHWKDSVRLFEYVVKASPGNALAHNNLGSAYQDEGRMKEAIAQYHESIRIKPFFLKAYVNLALAMDREGRSDIAIAFFQHIIMNWPQFGAGHAMLADILKKQDKPSEAITKYLESLQIEEFPEVHVRLGLLLAKEGKTEEAAFHFYRALEMNPALVDARVNLGILLVKKGMIDEARKEYLTALRVVPNLTEAHFSLGNLYLREGKLEDARRHLAEAVQADPDHAGARTNLGVTMGRQGNIKEATEQLEKAVALKPDFAQARDNLARAYWVTGRSSEALRELEALKKLNPAMAKQLRAWMDSTGPKPAPRGAS
jgi:tetratricopeptide (TPR) repeat protein